jgi:hypothetical protein
MQPTYLAYFTSPQIPSGCCVFPEQWNNDQILLTIPSFAFLFPGADIRQLISSNQISIKLDIIWEQHLVNLKGKKRLPLSCHIGSTLGLHTRGRGFFACAFHNVRHFMSSDLEKKDAPIPNIRHEFVRRLHTRENNIARTWPIFSGTHGGKAMATSMCPYLFIQFVCATHIHLISISIFTYFILSFIYLPKDFRHSPIQPLFFSFIL